MYVQAKDVTSPKLHWRLHRVLHDGGEGDWSAAEGQWENDGIWEDRLAIRWNGTTDAKTGNPQSRGLATWFIVPKELAASLHAGIEAIKSRT